MDAQGGYPEIEAQQPVQILQVNQPKHSGLGIGSFIAAAVGTIILLAWFVLLAVQVSKPDWRANRAFPQHVIIGLMMFVFLLIDLVALGLGVAALFQRNRKKVFAILGTCISAASVITVVGMMIIGFSHMGKTR